MLFMTIDGRAVEKLQRLGLDEHAGRQGFPVRGDPAPGQQGFPPVLGLLAPGQQGLPAFLPQQGRFGQGGGQGGGPAGWQGRGQAGRGGSGRHGDGHRDFFLGGHRGGQRGFLSPHFPVIVST